MLVGVGGKIAGYDGRFDFEGSNYPEGMKYWIMRAWLATFGVLIIPLAYWTSLELGLSHYSSFLVSWFLIFDNGFTVISRFILLDTTLLLFTATSLHCLVMFHNQRNKPFSTLWWLWLILSGASIGAVSSTKWVGLFSVTLIGIYTIRDLWTKTGDIKMKYSTYFGHWLARIFGLIIVPASLYVLMFYVHFSVLNRTGPDDGTLSSLFQYHLAGSGLQENPLKLAMGANITIRGNFLDSGLLHSHEHQYPEYSLEQQITNYKFHDDNNIFEVLPKEGAYDPEQPVQFISSETIVRLRHNATGKFMRVWTDWDTPVSGARGYHVSAGGSDNYTESKDLWRFDIYDDLNLSPAPEHVHSLTTRFQLRHIDTGCLLASSDRRLPDWGFDQFEVWCEKNTGSNALETLWNIEYNRHEKLEPAPDRGFKRAFWRDLFRINHAMWSDNNNLRPDEDRNDPLTSKPFHWPFMLHTIRMCGWGDNEIKFLMIGNPLVWWGSTAALVIHTAMLVYYQVRMRRGIREWVKKDWEKFEFFGHSLLLGWVFHFLPFYIMGRVLYFHHYFPALYFAIINMGVVIDFTLAKLNKSSQKQVVFLIMLVVLLIFWYFSPLTYGYSKPSIDLKGRKWISGWRVYGDE
jgi:dolichyl-phosphate-mannose-protein mannosyltransferase